VNLLAPTGIGQGDLVLDSGIVTGVGACSYQQRRRGGRRRGVGRPCGEDEDDVSHGGTRSALSLTRYRNGILFLLLFYPFLQLHTSVRGSIVPFVLPFPF
jgi:hypothetical protein